jgi:hypothetical protein
MKKFVSSRRETVSFNGMSDMVKVWRASGGEGQGVGAAAA